MSRVTSNSEKAGRTRGTAPARKTHRLSSALRFLRAAACGAVFAITFFALRAGAVAQAPKAKSFDDFPLLKTRNIFDPDRRAARIESSRDRSSTQRILRANTLSLLGTMVADGRALAFFSGSRSEYSKIIGIGDTVADHQVKAISTAEVELERGGKTTTLAVGKVLTLEGTVEVDAPAAPDAPPDTSAAVPPTGTDPVPASSTDKNDVLRRMMERRAKEMNK